MARIAQHDPRIVLVEGENEAELAHAITMLRPGYGDTLAVSDMSVLGTRREELRSVVHTIIDERGARIVDGDNRTTDNVLNAIDMVLDAMKRKGLSSKKAAEIAKLSRGNEISLERKNATKEDWMSDMTNEEIVERHGISYATLRRHWRDDRINAGLPPVDRGRGPGRRS